MHLNPSSQGAKPSVSIVLVNYKTPTQTKLCLRSLRRFTTYPCDVTVVDNRSEDESTEYLRQLSWVRLLENPHPEPTHRNGLDLAIQHAPGEIIVAMHTDTFVRRDDWLQTLLQYFQDDTMVVGSPVRVVVPSTPLARLDAYRKRYKLQRRWRAIGAPPKLITHCILYRKELFTDHAQQFDYREYIDGVYNDCGEFIQRYCEREGMGVRALDFRELSSLFWHFEAATLNLVTGRRIPLKRRMRTWSFYRRADVKTILGDVTLDS